MLNNHDSIKKTLVIRVKPHSAEERKILKRVQKNAKLSEHIASYTASALSKFVRSVNEKHSPRAFVVDAALAEYASATFPDFRNAPDHVTVEVMVRIVIRDINDIDAQKARPNAYSFPKAFVFNVQLDPENSTVLGIDDSTVL